MICAGMACAGEWLAGGWCGGKGVEAGVDVMMRGDWRG